VKAKFTEGSDKLIVIGASAGAIMALKQVLAPLKKPYPYPIIIIIHRLKNVRSHLLEVIQNYTDIEVIEPIEKQSIETNTIYLAPSNYHLLVEREGTFSLSVSENVNYSRPSIDVTFVSAAEAFGQDVVGIILTGANEDGAMGLKTIANKKGKTLVQDPEEAQVSTMPKQALKSVPLAQKVTLDQIGKYLKNL